MWVGSLLTVGTNVKIRGLASVSPGETYEICKKLDFQPCQGFLALFFMFHIYLIHFEIYPLSPKIIGSDYWLTTNKLIRKIPIGSIFMLKSERGMPEYQLLLKGCAFSFIYTEFT